MPGPSFIPWINAPILDLDEPSTPLGLINPLDAGVTLSGGMPVIGIGGDILTAGSAGAGGPGALTGPDWYVEDWAYRDVPNEPATIPDRIINDAAPIPPTDIRAVVAGAYSRIGVVYGRARVVGKLLKFRASGRYIYFSYIFCRGEVEEIERLSIDGREVDVSANSGGAAFANATLQGDGINFYSGATIQLFTGTSGQDVSSWWTTGSKDASQTDTWANWCIVCFGLNADILDIRSFPRVEAVIKGFNVRDPRTSPETVAYTNNPALCLAHFLETYVDTSKTVDNTTLADAADYHDQTLTDTAVSPNVDYARRTLNIWLNQRQDIRRTIALLEKACGVYIHEEGDTWYLTADKATTVSHTIGDDRVLPNTTTFQRTGNANAPADVRVIWFDVTNNEPGVAEALGTTSGPFLELQCPWIDTYPEARRVAIETLNHLTTEDSTIQTTVKGVGLKMRRGEVMQFSNAIMQVSQNYRIIKASMLADGVWRISGKEYQEASYSDDVSTNPITSDFSLPDPYSPPALTNLTAIGYTETTTGDGSENTYIEVSWDAVTYLFAKWVDVELYDTNSPQSLINSKSVPAYQTSTRFEGLAASTDYEVRAKQSNTTGSSTRTIATDNSASPNTTTITTPPDTTAPGVPSGYIRPGNQYRRIVDHANQGGIVALYAVEIDATPPSDEDFSHFILKYLQITSGAASGSDEPTQRIEAGQRFAWLNVAAPDNGLWLDVNYAYLNFRLASVDRSGNVSSYVALPADANSPASYLSLSFGTDDDATSEDMGDVVRPKAVTLTAGSVSGSPLSAPVSVVVTPPASVNAFYYSHVFYRTSDGTTPSDVNNDDSVTVAVDDSSQDQVAFSQDLAAAPSGAGNPYKWVCYTTTHGYVTADTSANEQVSNVIDLQA